MAEETDPNLFRLEEETDPPYRLSAWTRERAAQLSTVLAETERFLLKGRELLKALEHQAFLEDVAFDEEQALRKAGKPAPHAYVKEVERLSILRAAAKRSSIDLWRALATWRNS